jgi:outer membrane protein assembly factor BamB
MSMLPPSRVLQAGCVLLAITVTTVAGEWPCFRGPGGLALTDEKDLPRTWGGKSEANVLWKTPLKGDGQSSPVVWRDRVIVTTVNWPAGKNRTETFPEHHVTCHRVTDGKELWDTLIEPGPWLLKDLRGGYCAPTPATDGERVYVFFGSAVLAALDLEGKLVWRKEIPPPRSFDVAIASSPLVYGDNVLLLCDQTDKKSRLFAFDPKTGEVKWDTKRPEVNFGHSTPVLAEVKGKPQLLVSASNALQGLDPESGKVLWWCAAQGDVSSPAIGGGVVYCDSGRGGPGTAVDPTGTGDVTKTHRKWQTDKAAGGFASPVIVGENLYRLANNGVLKCWKASSGDVVYSERMDGVSTTASPFVTPEGLIYFASAGKTFIVEAGPTFKVVAVNDLGENGGQASAAVADGRIFLKGTRHLFCVGKM